MLRASVSLPVNWGVAVPRHRCVCGFSELMRINCTEHRVARTKRAAASGHPCVRPHNGDPPVPFLERSNVRL